MLSKKEIEALKNGAYGVTRSGLKVRFVHQSDEDSCALVAVFWNDGVQLENYSALPYYNLNGDNDLDIISLWEDRPEPFDLERALEGDPVKWDGNPDVKSWVLQCRSNPGLYIVDTDNQCTNAVNVTVYDYDGLKKNCVMWKEPEPVKPSADDLPKPIREFGDLETAYIISRNDCRYIPRKINKRDGWTKTEQQWFENGLCYATEMACQKVCDWLMNR